MGYKSLSSTPEKVINQNIKVLRGKERKRKNVFRGKGENKKSIPFII